MLHAVITKLFIPTIYRTDRIVFFLSVNSHSGKQKEKVMVNSQWHEKIGICMTHFFGNNLHFRANKIFFFVFRIGNDADFDIDYMKKKTANFTTSLLITTACAFLTTSLECFTNYRQHSSSSCDPNDNTINVTVK